MSTDKPSITHKISHPNGRDTIIVLSMTLEQANNIEETIKNLDPDTQKNIPDQCIIICDHPSISRHVLAKLHDIDIRIGEHTPSCHNIESPPFDIPNKYEYIDPIDARPIGGGAIAHHPNAKHMNQLPHIRAARNAARGKRYR